jgi:rubrerythrin
MAKTKEQMEKEVNEFNDFFYSSSPETQEMFGGKPNNLNKYYRCWCGNTTFRESQDGDCPDGCTIGPIIWEGPSD